MEHEQQRKELADFLRTRRLRLKPMDVGLKVDMTRRRTPGLRREEVASLSGISLPWYTALEQAKDIRVSAQVLLSLARTLQLNEDEKNHLFLLANQSTASQVAAPQHVSISPALQQILDKLGTYPAYIVNKRWDVMAWNRAASAIFGDFDHVEGIERNALWRVFMLDDAKRFSADWGSVAQMLLAQFRSRYALYMNDLGFQELVNKLSQASAEFREQWSRHDVLRSSEGVKEIRHPEAGLLTFHHKRFELAENGDLEMIIYTPVEDSGTDERLEALLR